MKAVVVEPNAPAHLALENVEPPRASSTFASVEEELRSIARDGASVVVGKPAATTFSGLESGAEIK